MPRRSTWSRVALQLAVLSIATPATAEIAESSLSSAPRRVVLLHPPGEAEEGRALAQTIRSFLVDVAAEVVALERPLPRSPLENVQQEVAQVARNHDAGYVVWSRPAESGSLYVFVAHVRGATVVVRTIDFNDVNEEPPATLRSTIAAVVRAVVDTDLLAAVAEAQLSQSTPSPSPTALPDEGDGSLHSQPTAFTGSRWNMELVAAWGMRWVSSPGPTHQVVSAGISASGLGWFGLRLGGRLGLVATPAAAVDGAVWRAALTPSIGLERSLGVLRVGVLAGVDLEWIWGNVTLDGGRGEQTFRHFGVGAALRPFLKVSPWRGLTIQLAVDAAIRPARLRYLLQGVPTVSSGWVEIGIELGLGWQFL